MLFRVSEVQLKKSNLKLGDLVFYFILIRNKFIDFL